MLPNSGADEMKHLQVQLGGLTPSIFLHLLQKRICCDLVSFPFYLLYNMHGKRKWHSGEIIYSLLINHYRLSLIKYSLSSWMTMQSCGQYDGAYSARRSERKRDCNATQHTFTPALKKLTHITVYLPQDSSHNLTSAAI